MLRVHISDRLECLADVLAETLVRSSASDLFATETILVQNRGMERWLSMRLAERLGVWAMGRFPFPKAFLWELAGRMGIVPPEDPFAPQSMVWRLMAILPDLHGEPERYLRKDADGRRLVQLARRVAERFDQYAILRPDMLDAWGDGRPCPELKAFAESAEWQADAWRRLLSRAGAPPPAQALETMIRRLEEEDGLPEGTPGRVSVFGVTALPPLYLRALAALARRIDVFIYAMSPCKEMWFDTRSPRSVAREKLRERKLNLPDGALHFDDAPMLLALNGAVGRDFLASLYEAANWNVEERWSRAGDDPPGVLGHVRSALLNFENEPAPDGARPAMSVDDDSIRVHVCHSPHREIETLRDAILDRFERYPDLTPRDVIVMAPDIDIYAQSIEAVFGAAHPRIPFSIADRSPVRLGMATDALRRLMSLPDGDFEASEVFDLLGCPPVARRFGLDESSVQTIRTWIADAGIRRGRGATHPPSPNSWRFGMDRLVMGNAVEGGGMDLFAGILPASGNDSDILEGLCAFHEALGAAADDLAGPHAAPEWAVRIERAIGRMMASSPEDVDEIQTVLSSVAEWGESARQAGYDPPIPLPAARDMLMDHLDRSSVASPFLSGGITCCNLMPMRSIPFRFVCMLGMNDDAFPRQDHMPGFDLIRRASRPGDRSRRTDDRYLFLECLFAARDALRISYVGRDIRTDEPRPPSVCICELLDCLDRRFVPAPGFASARDAVALLHPLQPFSPRYYNGTDPRLFSYSRNYASMDSGLASVSGPGVCDPIDEGPSGDGREVDGGWMKPLPPGETEDARRVFTLSDMDAFFRNPARGFLRFRLDARERRNLGEMEDSEPLLPDDFNERTWARTLVAPWLSNDPAGVDPVDIVRAAGAIPDGPAGDAARGRFESRMNALRNALEPWIGAPFEPPVQWNGEWNGLAIDATLGDVRPEGLVRWFVDSPHASDLIKPWMEHLVLCAAGGGRPFCTRLIWPDGRLCFFPVESAVERLHDWMDAVREGLTRVLPFWPAGSLDHARAMSEGKSPNTNNILNSWTNDRGTGYLDRSQFLQSMLARNFDPLTPSFESWSMRLWGPMIEAIGEGALP